jgi:integrase/recombinase XerC
MRGCEVARLRLEDVDLAARVVRVHGKGGRERSAPLGKAAAEWLSRYLVDGRSSLNPTCDAFFAGATGRRLEVAGIRARLVPLTPHDLRRAAAAHCQARGMNIREIQEFLGHADLNSTARYTGFDLAELRDIIERYHPRARLNPHPGATECRS